MDKFKQYLPWIIVAAVGLYLINRLRGGRTVLAPQTQFTQTPQPDPFATLRGEGFAELARLGIASVESETQRARDRIVGEVEIEKARLSTSSFLQAANIEFLQREQDRRLQKGAIDRYYSSRDTANITSSVNTALSSIFGGGNRGTVFGTPPTFPRFG